MLMMINFLLSLIFLFLTHPMMMGFILLMQTITISMITGLLNLTFWFSYILFLVMIGGMLVLFIYMTSIASNEMFVYSNKIMMVLMTLIIAFMILFSFTDEFFMNSDYSHLEMMLKPSLNFNLTKNLNYPSMYMIFFMISYLFITLIAVVKITKIEYGPLRISS